MDLHRRSCAEEWPFWPLIFYLSCSDKSQSRSPMRRAARLLSPLLVLACNPTSGVDTEASTGALTESTAATPTTGEPTTEPTGGSATEAADTTGGAGEVLGHCTYTNKFS